MRFTIASALIVACTLSGCSSSGGGGKSWWMPFSFNSNKTSASAAGAASIAAGAPKPSFNPAASASTSTYVQGTGAAPNAYQGYQQAAAAGTYPTTPYPTSGTAPVTEQVYPGSQISNTTVAGAPNGGYIPPSTPYGAPGQTTNPYATSQGGASVYTAAQPSTVPPAGQYYSQPGTVTR